MSTRFHMAVPLRAIPGSNAKKGFVNPRTGRVIIVDKAKGKANFTAEVKVYASCRAEELAWQPATGAVMASYRFFFARPQSHYGSGKNADKLKPSAPELHIQRPDLTNLLKCMEDALKGIVWRDDCHVSEIDAVKFWDDHDRIEIEVTASCR